MGGKRCTLAALLILSGAQSAAGQAPTQRRPSVSYTVTLDSLETRVEMRFSGLPDSFRLALAVHPEYDNRYWRFISDIRVEGPRRDLKARGAKRSPGIVTRIHNTLFAVSLRGGNGRITYAMRPTKERLPDSRAAWHLFTRETGALAGGPDTFLYLPDFPDVPVTVAIHAPYSWKTATGLREVSELTGRDFRIGYCVGSAAIAERPTNNSCMATRKFAAASFATLLDSPILLGAIHRWDFSVAGIPHHIGYWPLPNGTPFDTAALTQRVAGIAREAYSIFGRAPFTDYSFLFQDGAWGALEHANSVTIGLPSSDLAKDVNSYLTEITHEFFHAWNLMALRPAGWGLLSYDPPKPTTSLWWSEGVTMYYAYLLPRRIGFPEQGHTRVQQLQEDLGEYFSNAGNAMVSPEHASLLADAGPGDQGDYHSDYYLVGRLIGEALELLVSDATHHKHGLDEVMRVMYERHAKPEGFGPRDVERAVSAVCSCDLTEFFNDHVRSAKPLDFDRYLSTIGLTLKLDTVPVTDSAGVLLPDDQVWANPSKDGGHMQLVLFNPNSVWSKAGLHSGEEIVTFNGVPIDSMAAMRRAVRSVKLNDVVAVDIIRGGRQQRVNVTVAGYTKIVATISDRSDITRAQIALRDRWLAGRLAEDELTATATEHDASR